MLAILFGTVLGFFVALVLSYFLFPLTGQVDPNFMAQVVDSHHQIYPEQREVNFYRLCVILGVCFGLGGVYWQRFIKWYAPIAVGLVLLILALNFALMNMIKSISSGDFYTQADVMAQSLSKALLSTLPFVIMSGMWGMNVDNIPLQHHAHAFLLLLGLQLAIGASLLIVLKWRKIL